MSDELRRRLDDLTGPMRDAERAQQAGVEAQIRQQRAYDEARDAVRELPALLAALTRAMTAMVAEQRVTNDLLRAAAGRPSPEAPAAPHPATPAEGASPPR